MKASLKEFGKSLMHILDNLINSIDSNTKKRSLTISKKQKGTFEKNKEKIPAYYQM
jgi:hypothetical protein